MTEIASQQNPKLKALRRLHTKRERARSGRFLAEGEDLIAAAVAAGRAPLEGYRLAGSDLGGEGFFNVERFALASVTSLGSGTRVIGVYEQRWQPTAEGPLCVYLHGVGDPGNVGTILRSAQAFGASCVAFGPSCADPHGPKAVRASMGAIFAVALARVKDVSEMPGERIALCADAQETLRGPGDLEASPFGTGPDLVPKRSAELTSNPARADDDAGVSLSEAVSPHDARPPKAPVTLVVGAERDGLPDDVIAACDRSARIPIATESLNAAMAATVALYEMTREPSRVPTA